ncbi:MAG: AMP-binding protein [Planctomycetaceae bacterium]
MTKPPRNSEGKLDFIKTTFRELDEQSEQLARGLRELGVQPGHKLTLMVPYSTNMLKLTFGIVKSGATVVLVDPGMGRSNILKCLQQVDPDGFIGIPIVQLIRKLNSRKFPNARFNVTIGKRWFWGGPTLRVISTGEIEFVIAAANRIDRPGGHHLYQRQHGSPQRSALRTWNV